MKIINLPPREDLTVTVIPVTVEVYGKSVMRGFVLDGTEYSMEEAVALEGHLGYVVLVNSENTLVSSIPHWDAKGRPCSITAVCFTKPK